MLQSLLLAGCAISVLGAPIQEHSFYVPAGTSNDGRSFTSWMAVSYLTLFPVGSRPSQRRSKPFFLQQLF